MSNRKVRVEVLPALPMSLEPVQQPRSPAEIAALLDQLVERKVREILAQRDAFYLEPWFRTRQLAYEIQRLQTIPERKKWGIWFQRNGCLVCRTKKKPHFGNGMCHRCRDRVFQQLKAIEKELAKGVGNESSDLR